MASYIITYDLLKSGQNYDCLYKKLRTYNSYCHLQDSVWMVTSENDASTIANVLRTCLDLNDKLFVAKLEGDWATIGHSEENNGWLHSCV